MNVALIDMGSNSIRLAVYKVEQKDFEPIFSNPTITAFHKMSDSKIGLFLYRQIHIKHSF